MEVKGASARRNKERDRYGEVEERDRRMEEIRNRGHHENSEERTERRHRGITGWVMGT